MTLSTSHEPISEQILALVSPNCYEHHMAANRNRLILSILIVTSMSCASNLPRVQNDLETYDIQIKLFKDNFAKTPENSASLEWVKTKLDHMYEIDQYMRNYWSTPIKNNYSRDEKNEFNKNFFIRNNEIDLQNTSDIKALLKKYEWFKVSVFGKDADNKGWLIVQHFDQDIEFQKEVLLKLEKLYPIHETAAKNYAYLFDRVANSPNDPAKRKPQRLGTQGQCVGPGKWEPWPIEDEKNVDQRRKSMGLNSMAEYIAIFKEICL